MKQHIATVITLLIMVSACSEELPESQLSTEREVTIMELMIVTITPATDTLWGVKNPQTDEEWQVLDDAAVIVTEAFEKAKHGGAGPNDMQWAREAKWQAYIGEELAAAEAAREAIANRDLDALLEAGNAMYPPCENCHIDYNPAVQGEQY